MTHPDYGITVTHPDTVTHPSLPFCFGTRDIALWLASALARRDGATEASADRALERVITQRAADQLAASQRRERGVLGAS